MSLLHPLSPHRFRPLPAALRLLAGAGLLLAGLAQPGLAPAAAASPAIAASPSAHLLTVGAPIAPAAPRFICITVVITTANTGPGSLRSAVGCAVNQTVTFSSTLANQTINLASEIAVTAQMAIDGSGAPGVKVDGGGANRIFNISTVSPVTLTALMLQHGQAPDNGGAVVDYGGGLLTLNQLVVFSNTTPTGYGGGVYVTGDLTLSGTTFIDNESAYQGGGANAAGAVTITAGLFQNNRCTVGCYGGALYAGSTLVLTGTQFLTNTSVFRGGAVDAGASTVTNGRFQGNRCTSSNCDGGAYRTSAASTFSGTDFISNTSANSGGALDANAAVTVTNGTFQDNVCTAANCYGAGLHSPAGTMVISGTRFIHNISRSHGAGVYTDGPLVVTNAWFQSNLCQDEFCDGGGLAASTSLTLTGSTFLSNTADVFGGGVFTFHSASGVYITGTTFTGNACVNGSCEGAGLSTQGPAVVVLNSAFNGNQASGGGGGVASRNTLTLANVTLSGNHANFNGGGVLAFDGSHVRLLNVTLADNTAGGNGGGLNVSSLGIVTVTNTIISNNSNGNCFGLIAAGAHNLEFPAATCATAGPTAGFSTADPLLAPLALNAPGTTLTRALLPGSPARDHGDAATCAGPEVNNRDQRGVLRPIDGDAIAGAICDIGAYEAAAIWLLYLPLIVR